MLMLIDDADLRNIEELYSKYPYDGVTTNPTILSKTGNPDPMDQLKQIRSLIPSDAMLHAQVLSVETEDMVREAKYMVSVLGKDTFIKVPVTENGLKAISILSSENIHVTATAIYGTMSAFLAPYVNRLDNLGYNGVQTALDIHMMVKAAGYKAEVLGASFKNAQQVIDIGKGGIGAVTVSSDLLKSLAFNGIAENAVKDFIRDFESCCGEGKTMLDF